ncbi:hypothetical protein F2981_18965 (plasmid) [Sinorhizobium meliloti]|nr:hypothetical protein [Sinorhizobium meliloti]
MLAVTSRLNAMPRQCRRRKTGERGYAQNHGTVASQVSHSCLEIPHYRQQREKQEKEERGFGHRGRVQRTN